MTLDNLVTFLALTGPIWSLAITVLLTKLFP